MQSLWMKINKYCVELDDASQYLITQQMIATYNTESEQNEGTVKAIEQQITDLNKKLERLEERYVLEEINKEMYDK